MKKPNLMISVILCLFLLILWCEAQVEYNQAQALLKQNKTAEAIPLLKQAIQKNPENLNAYHLLGKIYLEKNQLDSAEYLGWQMLNVENDSAISYIILTQAMALRHNFAEALALVDKGLKRIKNSSRLYLQKGNIYLLADSTENAIAAYANARLINPHDINAYRGLAEAYMKLGADAMAILQLEKAIEIDSTQSDLSYQLARQYYKLRRYNEAARCYQRILKMDPTNDEAAWELGKLFYDAKHYEEAVVILEPYVKRQPDNNEAWLTYLDALIKIDRFKEVKSAAEHLLKKEDRSAPALRALAKSDYFLKEYDPAVLTYLKLSTIDTLSAEDYRYLGKSYMELKDDSLAVKYLELSLKKDPSQRDVWNDVGGNFMRMKKWDQAINAFQQRILVDSTSASPYVNLALCSMAVAKWENARVALYKALSLQPSYLKGHLYLARCLSQMDSTTAARLQYQKTIELAEEQNPANYKSELGEAYKMISFSYLIDKNYPKALDALSKTVEYRNDDVEVHLWRAQTLHALDKRKEAEAEYHKVLKLDPNNKDAKRGLEILAQYN